MGIRNQGPILHEPHFLYKVTITISECWTNNRGHIIYKESPPEIKGQVWHGRRIHSGEIHTKQYSHCSFDILGPSLWRSPPPQKSGAWKMIFSLELAVLGSNFGVITPHATLWIAFASKIMQTPDVQNVFKALSSYLGSNQITAALAAPDIHRPPLAVDLQSFWWCAWWHLPGGHGDFMGISWWY